MKTVLAVLSIALLAGVASATIVDFDNYNSTFASVGPCGSPISTGGLDFTAAVNCSGGPYMYVWDSSSPNGNGTPALIYAGFGNGSGVTVSLTGGGVFNLDSVDMAISWYDNESSEVVMVNGSPITLIQGLQTYYLNLVGVTSVTFSDVDSGEGYWLMDNVNYSTATPEPGTLALLGSGLLAGVGVLRRKVSL